MSIGATIESRPLLPFVILHLAAAVGCFAFFTVVPIAGCIVVMMIDNDPGGPMFFPIFIMGVVIFAFIIAAFLGAAVLLSDLLRRYVPIWSPPLAVFLFATGSFWVLASGVHPAVSPCVGIMVAFVFIVHWAGVSTVWLLLRKFIAKKPARHSSG
jgi:hypothetical protein